MLVLALLYGVQCVTWLPDRAVLFARPLGHWIASKGPGWKLLHPLPSGACIPSARLPLSERAGRWRGPGVPTWRAQARGTSETGDFAPEELAKIEAHKSQLRIGRHVFAGALDPEHAERLATLLREAARCGEPERRALFVRTLAESLSLEGYRETHQRTWTRTRWLARASNLYAAALFTCLPLAILLGGDEFVLAIALPLVGALHALTLTTLGIAQWRLQPGRVGTLVETLLSAAIYPPLLLRACYALRARALTGFHPAVVAVCTLPRDEGLAFLRAEVVGATARRDDDQGSEADSTLKALELTALWSLAETLGESRDTLLAAPRPRDPLALTYCPACWDEYRRRAGHCPDCNVALETYT